MCEPVSISIALIAVTTALAVKAQQDQQKAADKANEFNQKVLSNRQILASRQAEDALERGEQQKRVAAVEGKQLIGRQRVVLAANQQVVDEGSALDLTTDTAGQIAFEQLTIRNQSEREALGFILEGQNAGNEASLLQFQNEASRQATRTAIVGSILGGASQAAGVGFGGFASSSRVPTITGGGRGGAASLRRPSFSRRR